MKNQNLVPLIFSNKITPSPWNGLGEFHNTFTAPGNPAASNIYFFMDANGSARVRDIDGDIRPSPPGWIWTTTPGTSYEVSSTITTQDGGGDNPQWFSTGGNFIPVTAGSGLGTQVAGVSSDYFGSGPITSFATATFQITIRKVGTTTPVVVSTISLGSYVNSNQ